MLYQNNVKTFAMNLTAATLSAGVILLACMPNVAEAASGAHGNPKLSDLTWFFVNFGLFILIAYKLINKPFSKFWTERSELIASAVSKGERELALAQEAYQKAQSELDKLTPEFLTSLSRNIEADGRKEAEALLAQAKQKSQQLKKQVDLTVTAEQNAAQLQIRKTVAAAVLKKVEDIVSAKYTIEADQERRVSAIANAKNLVME